MQNQALKAKLQSNISTCISFVVIKTQFLLQQIYSDTKESLALAKANALIMGSSTEAVQNTHMKPSPTHEKPVQNKQQNRTIHQPR